MFAPSFLLLVLYLAHAFGDAPKPRPYYVEFDVSKDQEVVEVIVKYSLEGKVLERWHGPFVGFTVMLDPSHVEILRRDPHVKSVQDLTPTPLQ